MNINGKISLITGASSGLGLAIAEALIKKGSIVYGLARNEEKLQLAGAKWKEKFIPIRMDISNEKEIASFIEKTFSESHSPDILINNAGAGYFNRIDSLPLDQWHEMINTNLNGTFYITSKIVPFMKRNACVNHIINIGSILGKTSRGEAAAYSATKYGIQGFSEALFKELRGFKIKVTCLNPGSIDTHFFDSSGIEPHRAMLQTGDIADMVIHLLETPDNFLVDEMTIRPLIPTSPGKSNM
ncbi:MAG: SDR family NAD(P)-dependent oxidoreductase [Bacteroidetes bacterium]|nr:SDR family NAD(P)-dependent oxidoreductase [Bacteroidota bacterium]